MSDPVAVVITPPVTATAVTAAAATPSYSVALTGAPATAGVSVTPAATVAAVTAAAATASYSMVATGTVGPAGPQGPAGSGTGGTISVLATEDLVAFVAVTANGKRADSTNTLQIGKVAGISAAAILTGFRGSVTTGGPIVNASWSWTINDSIFLNGTALSTVAPSTGYLQPIGIATAADTISVEVQTPIRL